MYILGLSHGIGLLPRRFLERLGASDPDTLPCDPSGRRPRESPTEAQSLREMITDRI